MRDVSFGQYYPTKSFVHALDARAKLLLVVAYIAFIFFVDTFAGFAFAAVCLCVPIALSRVPLKLILKSLRAILFLIVFTMILNVLFFRPQGGESPLAAWWIFTIYRNGLEYAAKMAVRLILLIVGPSLLTLTTSPMELTGAIESLLKPLSWIRFPVHELAMIMSIALSIIPTIMEETDKIIKAQKARGADFESGNLFKKAKALVPVLVPLFVSSFRRADELAMAMDSRCYRGGKGRTKMKILRYGWRDSVAAVAMLLFGFGILLLRYNWFGVHFITLLY
ncbi:energy-coupling factor transporter transmembrane protein EcfT [Clostridia bacterium]|nr:energy-coupling factor transporter transmembrane protein EcfT [Clostridia bacterium]